MRQNSSSRCAREEGGARARHDATQGGHAAPVEPAASQGRRCPFCAQAIYCPSPSPTPPSQLRVASDQQHGPTASATAA